MEGEDYSVIAGCVEIDTRAPFKSVKEAVALFGERVLVGEIYANKLKEFGAEESENGPTTSRIRALTAELGETKQSLKKAREETNLMAHCISSLREELEQAKREQQKLKARDQHQEQPIDLDIEDIKFIENLNRIEIRSTHDHEKEHGYQRRRSVKFASPPLLAKVILSKDHDQFSDRSLSMKKIKRKPLASQKEGNPRKSVSNI